MQPEFQIRDIAVGKPCLGMHKLDNICSSSVYGLCVSDQLRGHLEQGISDRHTLQLEAPRAAAELGWQLWLQWGSHFRVLFRQWTPSGVVNSTSMKTKLTVWTTNIV